MKKIFAAAGLWLALTAAGFAQGTPNLINGQVPTAAQWNSYFAAKQNTLGYIPLNVAGGVMSGRLVTTAPGASTAGLNLTPGTTPGSPVNGDLWVTSSSIFARINGVTVNLLTPSAPCATCARTDVTNTFAANQIININGGATPAAQSGMILQGVAANAAVGRLEVDTYAGTTIITGVRANGTLASPTTLVSNDEILSLNAWGYDGTSRSGPAAAVRLYAGGTWSNTSHPTYLDFATVASASTTLNTRMRVQADGGVTIGDATVTSAGAGTLKIQSGITISGSFTATGLVGLPSLASQSANTVVGASAVGSPIALAMPSCVGSANALQWTSGTGFNCQAITAAAGSIAVGTTTITGGSIGNILVHGASNILQEFTVSGSGSTVAMNTAPVITGGSHVAITSLGIRSTGAAFDMTIASSEVLTAGRTLTVTLNDSARILSMNGNVTFGNTFQTGTSSLILTTTGATNVTVPTTGTLATLAGVEALTNKTINGNTLTAGTWTLTGVAGKTLTFNKSITLDGTDATTMTFPSTSATIARTDAGQTFTGTNTFGVLNSSAHVITSAGAAALSVGLNGSTNPAFNVDASTASSATGWNMKSAAAAAGVALSVISSGTNENGTIDAKGSGTLSFNLTATGNIVMGRAVTLNSTINKVTITAPATGSTITVADGKTATFNNSITFAGTDATTMTFPSSNGTIATLNLTSQVITGGAIVTVPSAQTTSFTANCGTGPLQAITGPTSAWSITAPANDGSCVFLLTNAGASAVIPTFSGFSVGSNTGDALTSVGSSKFMIWIARISGSSSYSVKALQ
jgi:hypothetical protein